MTQTPKSRADHYRAAEVAWYRKHGKHPERIALNGDGQEQVIGDASWNAANLSRAEYVEWDMKAGLAHLWAPSEAAAGEDPAGKPTFEQVAEILRGIDETEAESEAGWWETSAGAKFGAARLAEIRALFHPQEPDTKDPT